MANPPAHRGTGITRLDPAIRSKARLVRPALPFAIIAAIGVSRMVIGPGWGLLPLLAVAPAVAAAVGDEVIRYVGHAPKDDVTLLVVYRDGSITAGLAHARMA
jgi:hypothetical protein